MTTVFDVPSEELVSEVAKKLHKEKDIQIPSANKFSRTGVAKESPPKNNDWWYKRCASILRKIYISDIIGTERLRAMYSDRKNRGSKPSETRPGSGSIVRRALQQLEKSGYITKVKGKGRMLTSKGRSFLDNTSHEVFQNIKDNYPELKKY